MNKYFFILLFFGCSLGSFGQGAAYTGDWQGTLDAGTSLTIIFHIRETPGGLTATADSPVQASFGIKCDTVYVNSSGLHIEMRRLRAAYAGVINGDSLIIGTFTQGGPMPLVLKRFNPGQVTTKPQEPLPPFPYLSEDVEFKGRQTGLTYGATVTIPKGKGPFPAAVLITGSGQQTRDEELMGHKTFAVLADALTRNGIMVLRVDDRGIGKSSGDFSSSTSGDFALDVSESLDYLQSRKEADRKKMGLIGHSEGGMIAPVVASTRSDIDFIVLLAAPGVPIRRLMTEQSGAMLRSMGVPDSAVKVYGVFYEQLMQTLTSVEDSATAVKAGREYMNQWAAATDTATLRQLQLLSPLARMEMFRLLAKAARGPWYRYFFSFDPQPYLRKLKTKVLALNGSKDIQVLVPSNTDGISEALSKSPSKKYTVKVIPGLNHLFQSCNQCTVAEYATLQETFSPLALKEINDWLNSNVK